MWLARTLTCIGALNWGLVGLFRFDLVAFLFGSQTSFISRIIYTLIGVAGVSMLIGMGAGARRPNRAE